MQVLPDQMPHNVASDQGLHYLLTEGSVETVKYYPTTLKLEKGLVQLTKKFIPLTGLQIRVRN